VSGRIDGLRKAVRRRRPTTRSGRLKAGLAAGGLVVLAVVAVVGVVVVFPWVYEEYGYHPAENARSWAALTPQYADATLCQRCHEPEYGPWQESPHATTTCESCHGPLGKHAATAPEEATGADLAIELPSEALCVVCHEQLPGRPADFAQVDLDEHFGAEAEGPTCRTCHDPHTTVAITPPVITHPLDNLPACTTCHAPSGLKPVPAGHVEAPDAVCRSCHKPMTDDE
jgi:hypothetical protein